jgi:hypothetical protein
LSQQKQAKPASRQVVVNTTVIIPTFLSTSTVIVPISETRIPFPITQYDVFPTTQTEYLETCTITNLENYYAPTCNPPINRCGLYGEGGALQDSVVFKSPFFITAVSFLGILFTALSVVIYLLYGRLLVSKKAKKESEVTSNVLDGLTSLVAAQAMSQMFSTHTQMAAQQQLPMSRPGSIYQMHGSGPLIQDVSNMPMARPQSAGNYASSRASLHNPAAAGSYGNFRQSNYLEDYN